MLTDWRGVFTAKHPRLLSVPHTKSQHHTDLAMMALQQASDIDLTHIPDNTQLAWKKIASTHGTTLFEHPTQARNVVLMSGDARTVLHHCLLSSHDRYALEKQFSASESEGILPIGIAMKHVHASSLSCHDIHEMTFIGIAHATFDRILESHHVLRTLHNRKIQVKIVSPMLLRLSQAIVRDIGLVASEDTCITGDVLSLDRKSVV